MVKSFEEKSGQNRGYYIVTDKKDVFSKVWLEKSNWMELSFDCWKEFYTKHKVKSGQIIWTHGAFGAQSLHEKTYRNLVVDLNKIHYVQP